MVILHHVQRNVFWKLNKIFKHLGKIGCSSRRHVNTDSTSSALFISNSVAQHTASTQVDLNLNWQFTVGLDLLRESLKHRGHNPDIADLIADFRTLRKLESRKTTLDEERDSIADMMKALVKAEKKSEDIEQSKEMLKKRGKEVRENIKELMPELWDIEERVMLAALCLPNSLHSDTPTADQQLLKKIGVDPNQGFQPNVSHADVGRKTGLLKFSNVGPTSYYLKGELAILEQTLLSFVTHTLREWGFTQLSCPEVFRTPVIEAIGIDVHNPAEMYRLSSRSDEETKHPKIANFYHLQGVSSASFSAFLTRTVTDPSSLPMKYFSVGRNYSSKDIDFRRGLYGASQSIQGHVFAGCQTIGQCEEVRGEIENLLAQVYSDLDLPVRLVRVPARNLHRSEMYRCDVQLWSAPYATYIQVGQVSILGDYVSRRLNIHLGQKHQLGEKSSYLMMVHGCVMNITRVLAGFLETKFTEDNGCFSIPTKLQQHRLYRR